MEGLSASVVLIAILLGVLLVVVFDVFCLLHLGTADSAPFLPRFAWAVLIVVASPIGGLGYLLAQRLRTRWPEPVAMRPRSLLRNEAWDSPSLAEYRHAPSTPLGHGVTVMAIAVAAIWLRRARSWRPRRLRSRPGARHPSSDQLSRTPAGARSIRGITAREIRCRANGGTARRCNVRNMEGLSASVVLICDLARRPARGCLRRLLPAAPRDSRWCAFRAQVRLGRSHRGRQPRRGRRLPARAASAEAIA